MYAERSIYEILAFILVIVMKCEIDKYLNNCTYVKQAVDNLFKDEMPNATGDTGSSKNLYNLFFSVDFIANYNYFLLYVKCCNATKFMFLKA